MDRVEFELQNKDEAEKFRQTLDEKIPPGLRREDWPYSNQKEGIDFFHITFQEKGRRAATYSYERGPNGLYICILDLRGLDMTIDVPGKTITPNTLEFLLETPMYLLARNTDKKLQERGFQLSYSTGKHYHPTFSFAHQAILKGEKFAARYDQERDGDEYVCHLDLDMESFEQIKDLLQEWIQELFNHSSDQKTPHHTSPQCVCESARST